MTKKPFLRHRQGFSLVESAIVLGVVGLMLSSVWTALDNVQRNRKAVEQVREINVIANNARSIFCPNAQCQTFTLSDAVKAGVFPVLRRNASGTPLDLYGGQYDVSGAGGEISITYDISTVTAKKDLLRVLYGLSGGRARNGLSGIGVPGVSPAAPGDPAYSNTLGVPATLISIQDFINSTPDYCSFMTIGYSANYEDRETASNIDPCSRPDANPAACD